VALKLWARTIQALPTGIKLSRTTSGYLDQVCRHKERWNFLDRRAGHYVFPIHSWPVTRCTKQGLLGPCSLAL